MYADTVSGIGQADNTVAVSNNIHSLQLLLQLLVQFSRKYEIEYCHDKTRLQVLSLPCHSDRAYYDKIIDPVKINSKQVDSQTVQNM